MTEQPDESPVRERRVVVGVDGSEGARAALRFALEEAALELMDFLASPEHARWVVENLATIPPREVDTEGLEVSPLFAQVLEDTAELSSDGDFGYNIDVLVTDAFNDAMYDGVQAVFTGQATPPQVAANLEAASS